MPGLEDMAEDRTPGRPRSRLSFSPPAAPSKKARRNTRGQDFAAMEAQTYTPVDFKANLSYQQSTFFGTQMYVHDTYPESVILAEDDYNRLLNVLGNLLDLEDITYYKTDLELGTETNRWHSHLVVQTPKRITVGGVIAMFKAHGQVIGYVAGAGDNKEKLLGYLDKGRLQKEAGIFKEIGRKRQDKESPWDLCLQTVISGSIADVPARFQIMYLQNLQKLKFIHNRNIVDLTEQPDNLWIFGKPGVGKSRLARWVFEHKDHKVYHKDPGNKWFDGYEHQTGVLLDDMEKDSKYMGHLVKMLGDRYAFIAEVKGGQTMVRPKLCIVTSNYQPDHIWPDDKEMVAAISRRFCIICLTDFEVAKSAFESELLLLPGVPHPIKAGSFTVL